MSPEARRWRYGTQTRARPFKELRDKMSPEARLFAMGRSGGALAGIWEGHDGEGCVRSLPGQDEEPVCVFCGHPENDHNRVRGAGSRHELRVRAHGERLWHLPAQALARRGPLLADPHAVPLHHRLHVAR